MDPRVDEREDPDGRRDVADAGPHAHHGARVVVGLQRRALLALGQDDGRVEDLVELGEVEDPAVVRQALVPEAPGVRRSGHAALGQLELGVVDVPAVRGLVEDGGVAVAARAVDVAERVGDGDDAVGVIALRPRAAEGPHHSREGPGGVDGEEDVVQDDEDLEEAGLAEGPGPVPAVLVDAVEDHDGGGVDAGDGDGHLDIEQPGVELRRDVEGLVPGGL